MTTHIALLLATAVGAACPATAAADWARTGDRKRTVTLTDGSRVLVGPCRFQRLHYDGRIDWRVTPHLPEGDRFAKRYGCGFDVLLY